VECYLQNEGALVRFWYPVVYLERPPPGYRKSPSLRGTDAANMLVHRWVWSVYMVSRYWGGAVEHAWTRL